MRLDRAAARVLRTSAIRRPAAAPPILFVASGGAGAWQGMGRALYRAEPAFRESIDACAAVVARVLERDIMPAFAGNGRPDRDLGQDDGVDRADDSRRRRPASERSLELLRLGALQIAQCDLWQSIGVRPHATVGISLGEVAAAYAAGALSRDDASKALCTITNAVEQSAGDGIMFTVRADRSTADALCARAPAPLELLGTLQSERCLLLSSVPDGDAVGEFLAGSSRLIARAPSPWSYHTLRGTRPLREMEALMGSVASRHAHCPIFSAAAGQVLRAPRFDGAHLHWVASRPFYFDQALAGALRAGVHVALSIGAHPVHAQEVRVAAAQLDVPIRLIDSSRRDEPELDTWRRSAIMLRPRRALRHSRSVVGPPAVAPLEPPPETLSLADPEVAFDPFAHYERLRRRGSVCFLPREQAWLVLGFDDVRAVLSRPKLYSSRILAWFDPLLVGADGSPHAAIRRALAGPFARAAEALQPELDRRAATLVAPLAAGEELDVVGRFASPLASFTAARLLGSGEPSSLPTSIAAPSRVVATFTLFETFGRDLERLADESRVAHELRAEHGLSESQVRSLLRFVWIAATSTTANVIGWSIRLLCDDLVLRERLIADQRLIDAFVGEVIRLHPPELFLARVATTEVSLGGTTIPEGGAVWPCLGAANRDPSQFVDPDAVRLDRDGPQLGFGAGSHKCPGERLARMEAASALRALLRVAPGFEIAQPPCMLRHVPAVATHAHEHLVIVDRR